MLRRMPMTGTVPRITSASLEEEISEPKPMMLPNYAVPGSIERTSVSNRSRVSPNGATCADPSGIGFRRVRNLGLILSSPSVRGAAR